MNTKQNFEFTAALIHAFKNGASAYSLALIANAKFEKENPRFDSERFLKACGVELKPEKGTAVPVPSELKQDSECGRVIHRAGQSFREAGYNNFR